MNNIYKTRPIDKHVKDALMRGETALLVGEAGSGKTTMCEQMAADLCLPFLRVALDDSATLRDFIGTTQASGGSTHFEPGLLLETLQKPSLVLFDEFNALPPSRLFFMHELLDHRRLFVKEQKMTYDVHPECILALACNPPSVKYSGTNRMNSALIDRTTVFNVPALKPQDVPEVFDTGNPQLTDALTKFYGQMNDAIHAKNIRTVFSLRAVKRIVAAMKSGVSPLNAIQIALANGAQLTGGESEAKSIMDIAKTFFNS